MRWPAVLFASLCIVWYVPCAAGAEDAPGGGQAPLAIPTFHCPGLYWSPPGGAADRKVEVRYRQKGASEWKEALPMRCNPILHVRSPQNHSASDNKQNADGDFDHDLFNGRVPQSQEAHGVRGEPIYAAGRGCWSRHASPWPNPGQGDGKQRL